MSYKGTFKLSGKKKDIKEFSIPYGYTSFDSYAFKECLSLTNITIPKSLICAL